MEEVISLSDLMNVLKKRVSLIFISLFIGLGMAGIVTYFLITPMYSSRAQLIVRLPQSETANVNEINGNLQMINTYKDLIKSDVVMKVVRDKMQSEYNSDLSIDAIKDSVSVNQSPNSQMFSIEVKDTDPFVAQNIANLTALTFQERAKDTLSVDKINIISEAVVNTTPVSPNNKLNLLLGMVVGALLGIFLSFVLELLDKTIKEEHFIEELGFTVLGIVPNMTMKELNARVEHSPVQTVSQTNYINTDESGEEDIVSRVESRKNRPRV